MNRHVMIFAVVLSCPVALAAEVPDLAWLQGAWCGEADGTRVIESWLPPAGGMMLGLHQDIRGDRTTGFEFLRIEYGESGTAYVAQPGGAPPTRFALVEAAGKSLHFADPGHDFPKRIHYALKDPDTLVARVDDGTDEGQALAWTWKRCDPAASR